MRHGAVYILVTVCYNTLSMPIGWHKMYWKESLTIKGSAIYQLANYSCIYPIKLFHTYLKHYRSFICLSNNLN